MTSASRIESQLGLLKKHSSKINWGEGDVGLKSLISELEEGRSRLRIIDGKEADFWGLSKGLIRETSRSLVKVLNGEGTLELVETLAVINRTGETIRTDSPWGADDSYINHESPEDTAYRLLRENLGLDIGLSDRSRSQRTRLDFRGQDNTTYTTEIAHGLQTLKGETFFELRLSSQEIETNVVTLPNGDEVNGFMAEKGGRRIYYTWQEIS